MPTRYERMKAAEALGRSRSLHDLKVAIGLDPWAECGWQAICRRLSDLVEPSEERTCHVVTVRPHGEPGDFVPQCEYQGCSECGHCMKHDPFNGRWPAYCSGCGAKVIQEDM